MQKIKVLVIDDSFVIRNIVKQALLDVEQIEVVGEAADPFVARELIKKLSPDVLTLDVEMPKMDGITFLSNLMRLRPMPVVMLSSLTTEGAIVTLQALELGAIDFITKPSLKELINEKDNFRTILIEKIIQAAQIEQKNFRISSVLKPEQLSENIEFSGVKQQNHLVAIGASTGGTEALKTILMTLPKNSPAIVIVQHIPKMFSGPFAKRLNNCCQMRVFEASHGQKIKQGNIYVAPGDKHLTVVKKNDSLFCVLDDTNPVNHHKPSVDVLFNSLLPIADNVQAILLTGMGSDGAQGMLNLKNTGAMTIIQDQASCLIWGMPGKAFALNAHVQQLPLMNIAKQLLQYATLDKTGMNEVLDAL